MLKRLAITLVMVFILIVTASAAEITVTDITDVYASNGTRYFPVEISAMNDDGVKLLCKTFEVEPDVSPYELEEKNLVQNGTKYVLRDILQKQIPDGRQTKTVSQTVTVDSDSNKTDDILGLLQSTLTYSENGFTGELALDETSINTEATGTSSYHYAVTDTRTYSGLVRNDPALVTKTVQKNGVTLSLCDVKWSPGSDYDPNPASYTATATYKGSANGSKPDGFTATAVYSGEVMKTTPGNVIYTLVYAAEPEPVVLPEKLDLTLLWMCLGALLIISIAGAGIYFIILKAKRRPLREGGEETIISKRIHIPMALGHQDIGEDEDEDYDE